MKQCPKPHLDKCGSQPPPICYKCGDGDHVARNCTKDTGMTGCNGRQQVGNIAREFHILFKFLWRDTLIAHITEQSLHPQSEGGEK